MIVNIQSPLDTSGLTLAPPAVLTDPVTQAALDSFPVTGIQPANTIQYADTSSISQPINWWLVAAATGVFVLAASLGGRR